MPTYARHLPSVLTIAAIAGMLVHGPIAQLAHYHSFADTRVLFGIPNGADVLSNLPFAVIGTLGLLLLWPERRHRALAAGWRGYVVFFLSLILTAAGSAHYHLAPDDGRLVWDRLPIALACAGLLAAVRAETRRVAIVRWLALLTLAAGFSVAWWDWSGDLRPYLLLQAAPLVLVPLWQWIERAPRADRIAFGAAIALYVLAKGVELADHAVMSALGVMSGHTLKHLSAAAAAAVIALRLTRRVAEKSGAAPAGEPGAAPSHTRLGSTG